MTIAKFCLTALLLCGLVVCCVTRQCYQCDRVNHPADCTKVVTCSSTQVCTVVKYKGFGAEYYSTGCVDEKFCAQSGPPAAVGRRFLTDVVDCTSCCHSDRCNVMDCPPAHMWSDWMQWSSCSATCGGGYRVRGRACLDKPCTGTMYENEVCNTRSCAVVDHWSTWNDWTACSVTCGDGLQVRNRSCIGYSCHGIEKETAICTQPGCPIDGNWSAWSTWFGCSASCGGGTSIRVRTCSQPVPQNHGKPCPNYASFRESKTCNTQSCLDTTIHTTPTTVQTTSTTPQTTPTTVHTTPTTVKITTNPMTAVQSTARPHFTSVMTSLFTSPSKCEDSPICHDSHFSMQACNDTHIAAVYCPKLCGICTTVRTTTPIPCVDTAGTTCSDSVYLQYACKDKDLKQLCEKSCGVCH